MKSFIAIATALAGLASAYTTPVNGPVGNPILKPGLNEKVPVGKPYLITWTPDHNPESTVTILLLQGPSSNIKPLYPIVEKTPNDGSYEWTPHTDLPDSTEGFGLQLIVDSNGDYQWSTQFGFYNPHVNTNGTTSSYSPTSTPTDYLYVSLTANNHTSTEPTEYPTNTPQPYGNNKPYDNTTTTSTNYTTPSTKPKNYPKPSTSSADSPTYAPSPVVTTGNNYYPNGTSTPTPSTNSGVDKSAVVSLGMAIVALAVAGFTVF